jgi:sialidase-1
MRHAYAKRLFVDELEQRRLLSAAGSESVLHDMLSVAVVERRIFYNYSAFDGNDPAAGAADDAAIATNKSVLLPGGTATAANYTSFSRGVNGLMVDVAGMPSTAVTASDFDFRVGNSNDLTTWSAAPAPAAILVRPGAGFQGSTRIEVTWADGAIRNQWLQVTLKATPVTGLASPDVFYVGNAVGETTNVVTDAIVNTADGQGAHDHPQANAPIDSPYDFNRDGKVDASDEFIAGANVTTPATALQLIAPQNVPADVTQRPPLALFNPGDGGYPIFNIPAIVTTNAGSVLAFAEARTQTFDNTCVAIVMRRSIDGGITWSPLTTVTSVSPGSGVWINNPTPVVERTNGKVFLLFLHNASEVFVTESADDGQSWSAASDITSNVKVTVAGNPGPPDTYDDTPWAFYAVGPGHAIQLEHGTHAGRLLVPAYHRLTNNTADPSWSHMIYSDDLGASWHLGGGLLPGSATDGSNEGSLVELADGTVYLSYRQQIQYDSFRQQSRSYDGGMTWEAPTPTSIVSVKVEGSLLRVNSGMLLFSSPSNAQGNRVEMTLSVSYNDGQSWVTLKVPYFGPSGYSDMTMIGSDTLLLIFGQGDETGSLVSGQSPNLAGTTSFSRIAVYRINLRWLQSTEPYRFEWHFNEQAPGTTANTNGPTIQDYGPWASQAWAYMTAPDPAPQYVAGPSGETALRLTENSDEVVLTQGADRALQLTESGNLTVEVVLRTTDSDGVIIGSNPSISNWTLQVVGGLVRFSVFDGVNASEITSTTAINDGNWHRVAALRNTAGRILKLYVDGVEAASAATDETALAIVNLEPVTLGSYNAQQPSSQLSCDVDMVRVTRPFYAPSAPPTDAAIPAPPVACPDPSNAPTSLSGVQFWLSAYDPFRFFGDYDDYYRPLPAEAYSGMGTRSMLDASPNAYHITTAQPINDIQFASDSLIGPYWSLGGAPLSLMSHLWVRQSNGTSAANFDFVQNTGVFTLSAFVRPGADTGSDMTLFDTSEGLTTRAGFNLSRKPNGTLSLKVSGGTQQSLRFSGSPSGAVLTSGQWYHVAVVGSGSGTPVRFYVTPLSADDAVLYSATSMFGSNGSYPTDAMHDMTIGGRSNAGANGGGVAPFAGGLVNVAVFDQALSAAQVRELFLFGKGLRGADMSPTARQAFTGQVASLMVGNPSAVAADYAATIAWGDGQVSTGAISLSNGTLVVSGTNTYDQQGIYAVSVTIMHSGANAGVANGTATVGNSLAPIAVNVNPIVARPFTWPVAAFTVAGPSSSPGDLTCLITWGDGGVSAGTVTLQNNVYRVSGSHTYGAVGSYPISIAVHHADGRDLTIQNTATVRVAINAVAEQVLAQTGVPTTGVVATFTDLDPIAAVSTMNATIAWGDGQSSSGSVALVDGFYAVSGSHIYATMGSYQTNVTITDGNGNIATSSGTAIVSNHTQVADRKLFYRGSPKWNVTNASLPGFSDDNAIAPDKSAYLPGSGTATFSAVSSYSRGINGIMIDLFGQHGTITASDFVFKVGNNNSPGLWTTAPAPTLVTVRAGAGGDGSDRIELAWADNAIQKTWLQVVLRGNDTLGGSDANTGLLTSDVFYFGSAPGDSGAGDSGAFQVTSSDEVNARNNPKSLGNPATRSDVNDFNRDGLVNSNDQIIARNNTTNLGNQLRFLVVGAGGPFAPQASTSFSASSTTAPPPLALATGDRGVASALARPGGVAVPAVGNLATMSNQEARARRPAVDAALAEYGHATTESQRKRYTVPTRLRNLDASAVDGELLESLARAGLSNRCGAKESPPA